MTGNYYNQNPSLNHAVNDYDRKHTFVFYNVLTLPFGKGKALLGNADGVTNYLVSGWSVNTITVWASGLPFSPTYNAIECNFDRDTGPCRPNLEGDVRIGGDRNNYFTTTGGVPFARGADLGLDRSDWTLAGTSGRNFGRAGRTRCAALPTMILTPRSSGFTLSERICCNSESIS